MGHTDLIKVLQSLEDAGITFVANTNSHEFGPCINLCPSAVADVACGMSVVAVAEREYYRHTANETD